MFEVARGITAIDTFYGGRERFTAAYLLTADEPAIVETGPSTSFEPVVAGLQRLGIGAADVLALYRDPDGVLLELIEF